MAKEDKKYKKHSLAGMRARLFVGFLIVGIVVGWLLGRLMTVGYTLNPEQPLAGLSSMFVAYDDPLGGLRDFISQPFYVEWHNGLVLGCTIAGFLIPIFICLPMIGRLDPDVVEAGQEHGTERLATDKEMGELMDRRKDRFYNNIMCSEHCGVVIHPFNKKLKAASRARNLNQITMGMSGQGKSFNEVAVDIMQSVGDALPAKKYGMKNIFFDKHPKEPKPEDAPLLAVDPTPLEEAAAGFDFINTDPKGTNIKEFGNMLEAAGFEIYSFNTVNFEESDRYNPLAFIPMKEYDIIEPNKINFNCRVELDDETAENNTRIYIHDNPINSARGEIELYDPDFEQEKDKSTFIKASIKFNTKVENQKEELDAEEGHNLDVANVLSNFDYQSSTGEIWIEIGRTVSKDQRSLSGKVIIKFERSIRIVDAIKRCDRQKQENNTTNKNSNSSDVTDEDIEKNELLYGGFNVEDANNKGILECEFKDISPLELDDGRGIGWLRVGFAVEVVQVRMPDGVQLLKTVECLACQLQPQEGDRAASDPFWPASAQLLLTGLISLQFEMMNEEDWTLPVTVDLLDAMTPAEGNTISALDVLMMEWESGKMYEVAQKGKKGKGTLTNFKKSGVAGSQWVENPDQPPRSRSRSLALHCFYAIRNSAEDTFRSVLITAQMFFSRLVTPEMRWLLSKNELPLDCMGEANQRRCLFLMSSDTDTTYSFLISLLTFQQINLLCDKGFAAPSGALDRHVRFILDEVMNLGNISVLNRALAVVRSRNISISMFCQSRSQIDKVYGKDDTAIMFDNCSTMLFMGSQHQDTLDMMSKRLGQQTVKSRTFQNSFNKENPTMQVSEHVQSTGSEVKSAAEIARTDKEYMLVFMYNQRPALDKKYPTERHPYFAYCYPTSPRSSRQPKAVFNKLFDFKEYRARVDGDDLTRRIPYCADTKYAKNIMDKRFRVYFKRGIDKVTKTTTSEVSEGTGKREECNLGDEILRVFDRHKFVLVDVSSSYQSWSVTFRVDGYSEDHNIRISGWNSIEKLCCQFKKYGEGLKSGKIKYLIDDDTNKKKSSVQIQRESKELGDVLVTVAEEIAKIASIEDEKTK